MSKTPIIVGVGDYINRSLAIADAREPLDLILEAIHLAIADTCTPITITTTSTNIQTAQQQQQQQQLQAAIDSIDVVATWTWPYPDLPGLIAQRLGLEKRVRHKQLSPHGGNQPAKLLDDAARRVARGESVVAVIAGGEALASLGACAAAKKLPPHGWTDVGKEVNSVFSPTARELGGALGGIHSIGAPIHVYPLYENGFRAKRKQSIENNNEESARLYADFAQVAAENPMAWNYGKPALTKDQIKTVSKKNRIICYPYPMLMNAFNNINLAGACIITSTEFAEEIGIPKERWVYPLGGAGTRDAYSFWERPNFYSSPSIERSLDAALEITGLTEKDIDTYDLYSCFPIVPKLACQHLGIPFLESKKPLTLLGGLTSFGGAGNNYSMHAISEMTRRIRSKQCRNGLILANGGMLTYQFVVCLSSAPRKDGSSYPEANPLPENLETEPHPEMDQETGGEAVIETYTVQFDRAGQPGTGYIVARLTSNNKRVLANDADEEALRSLASNSEEQVGRLCWVEQDSTTEGRCVFTFSKPGSKL